MSTDGQDTVRIAMWSGPRNISTALLRSFGQRADTAVCDEPLYAHYLLATGAPHPGRDEVIAAHETEWRKVAAWLTGPVPGGRRIFYQKHMAHHLLPDIERGWLDGLTHAFLIREPTRMIASLRRVTPGAVLADTGLPQQAELFDKVAQRSGRSPPVIDALDVLTDPAGVLGALCSALGIPWDPAMLGWPAGPRDTDGVWARHWYAAANASTGFGRPDTEPAPPAPALRGLCDLCMPYYQRLAAHRLRA